MKYLSEAQLYRMAHEYKYQSAGTTWLEKVALQPFWNWLAGKLPMSWAPNAITLASFIQICIPTAIILIITRMGEVAPPAWACALAGLGVFGWQTLDAVDGKQARRTKSGTPMGEIFDHGCDNYTLLAMVRYNTMAVFGSLGKYNHMYTILGILSHWVSFLTYANRYGNGTMVFSDFGVSELQLTYAVLFVVSGFIGTSMWQTPIALIGLRANELAIGATIVLAIFNIAVLLHALCTTPGATPEGSVAKTHVLSPLPSLALSNVLVILSGSIANLNNFQYIIIVDLVAIKLCNKLIVNVITSSPFPMIDSTIAYLMLFTFNEYYTLIDTSIMLTIAFVCTLVDTTAHFLVTCKEMADYMKVPYLTIKKRID